MHENEKRILKALEKKRIANIEYLRESTGLKRDAIEKALLWAKMKGIIKIREEIQEFVELTKEGKEYVENRLPERNLLNSLLEGKRSIEELRKSLRKFSIGLVWAKKNGWIDIKNGFLFLTEKGRDVLNKKIPEEEILSSLREGKKSIKEFEKKFIERLLRRGLARKRIEKRREISLTEEGKKVLPRICLLYTSDAADE